MNEPRKIDYEFKVFLWERWVWLFDDSERTYTCSITPLIYAYPLYSIDWDTDYPPEPTYFGQETIDSSEQEDVMTIEFSEENKDAWDTAMEEAQANRRV